MSCQTRLFCCLSRIHRAICRYCHFIIQQSVRKIKRHSQQLCLLHFVHKRQNTFARRNHRPRCRIIAAHLAAGIQNTFPDVKSRAFPLETMNFLLTKRIYFVIINLKNRKRRTVRRIKERKKHNEKIACNSSCAHTGCFSLCCLRFRRRRS